MHSPRAERLWLALEAMRRASRRMLLLVRSTATQVECESHSSREFGTRCLLNLLEKYEGVGHPDSACLCRLRNFAGLPLRMVARMGVVSQLDYMCYVNRYQIEFSCVSLRSVSSLFSSILFNSVLF